MSSKASEASPSAHGGWALRRVQRTGSSSFTVTLPKWWTEEVGMHYGDVLRFRDVGSGKLEISLETFESRPSDSREKALTVPAHDAPPHLLPRLVVGAYLTGKDQVTLAGRLTPGERNEIRQTVDGLLGASIVEDGQNSVVIQNFVDPTRYSMSRLLDRLVHLLLLQVAECRKGVQGKDAPDRSQLVTLEDEVDRVYLLMVRQIVLACDNVEIAKNVGAAHHHSHMGYRMIAKLLEDLGDHLFALGEALCPPEGGRWEIPPDVVEVLAARLDRFEDLLVRTMAAFERASAEEADVILNDVHSDVPVLEALSKEVPPRVPSQRSSLAVERVLMGLQWVTQMLHVVNEVAINRAVDGEELRALPSRGAHPNPGPEPRGTTPSPMPPGDPGNASG